MARVKCTLPNASTSINGVQFVQTKDGMLSEDIQDEIAEAFTVVPGFTLVDRRGKPVVTPDQSPPDPPPAPPPAPPPPPPPPAPPADAPSPPPAGQ